MNRILITCSLILLCLTGLCQGSDVLTNKSIIDLHKAGLGKTLIIAKIAQSECAFQLKTENLIALKKAGLDESIIEAMLGKGSGEATPAPTQNIAAVQTKGSKKFTDLAPGIYYQKDSLSPIIELEPNVFSQSKQGSGILTAISYGIAKTKQKSTLSGDKANLQIPVAKPFFYFIFEKDGKGSLSRENQSVWFSSATSPNEFVLVKLSVNAQKGSREVVTGSYNSYEGMSSGIPDESKVRFKFQKLSQGLYKVYFSEPLPPGEYCLTFAGSGAANGTTSYKVFDFGVVNNQT